MRGAGRGVGGIIKDFFLFFFLSLFLSLSFLHAFVMVLMNGFKSLPQRKKMMKGFVCILD